MKLNCTSVYVIEPITRNVGFYSCPEITRRFQWNYSRELVLLTIVFLFPYFFLGGKKNGNRKLVKNSKRAWWQKLDSRILNRYN